MASKRNGVKTREWAKHLKPEGKRAHNKDVRRLAKTRPKRRSWSAASAERSRCLKGAANATTVPIRSTSDLRR